MPTVEPDSPKLGRVARALGWLARFGLDHPWWVLAVTALLTAGAVHRTLQLDIDTDLKALLPTGVESVTRLTRLQERVGGQSDLIVEVRSPDLQANQRFGADIARFLEAREDIRFLIFKRDKQVLEESVLLFLDLDKLEELRRRVRERIRREVRRQLSLDGGVGDDDEGADEDGEDPFGEDDDEGDDEDPFGEDQGEGGDAVGDAAEGNDGEGGLPDDDLALDMGSLRERFKAYDIPEYYTADEGRILVLKARPRFNTTEVRPTRELLAETRAEVERLRPSRYHPKMEVRLEGHYADMSGQVNTLKDDVLSTTAICLAILMSVVVLYFRRLRPLILVFVPLLTSVFWSLGLAELRYGSLNLISAFIFVILLGLGIDFGIHMVARYREELATGRPWRAAVERTATTTGVSVFTGATTTAVVFLMLSLARFKGFSQFGMVAGVGVVFSLLGVFLILPALIAVIEPRLPWRVRPRTQGAGPAWLGVARPGFVWALALTILVTGAAFAGYSAVNLDSLSFELDFSKLGNKKRRDPNREDRQADFRDAVGRVTTGAPAIVMGARPEDAEQLYRDLAGISELPRDEQARIARAFEPAQLPDEHTRALAERFGLARVNIMGRFLSKAFSLYTFLPPDQEAKLPILKDIRRRLEAKRALFEGEERQELDEFLAHVAREALTLERLPEWIRAQFRELDGTEGGFVILWTRKSKDSYPNARDLKTAFFDLEQPDGRTTPTAANYFVMVDVIDYVAGDAPVVFSLAFVAIVLLVGLQLRRVLAVALVLLPLLMALLWTCGFLYASDTKLNFYNMVLLPLLIGMGVDAGVHIYGRYREEGPGSLGAVVKDTGGAVFVAALTTAIGFGGVYGSDHIGLGSMGTLAIVGIALTMTSAVLALPALLFVIERWRARDE